MGAACSECRGLYDAVPCSKCDPSSKEPEVVEEPATQDESVDDEAGEDAE